jgi:hypothetical protein
LFGAAGDYWPGTTWLIDGEWMVNDLCKQRTTLTFHFFACGYLEVVGGADYSFARIRIMD